VQQRREQLLREGKLSPGQTEVDSADGHGADDVELHKSELKYQVLPEVLQAQTRIDEPNAARRKQYELRNLKGGAAPPTEEELRRYRLQHMSALSSFSGAIPRLSLGGRNRYNPLPTVEMGQDVAGRTQPLVKQVKPLPPEVAEAAKRTFLVGLRALTYGSLLGLGILAFGTTFLIQASGSEPFQRNVRESVRSAVQPLGQKIRQTLQPWRIWAQEKLGVAKGPGHGS
jgi:hypothetical protein